jgi:hypothetical protein
MATKSTIQTLINTNLADASNITASEHRAVENSLLNELYPTAIYETQATTNTITAKNTTITNLDYQISIVKQGRLVTITGILWNNTSAIVSDTDYFFEIINTEYFPDTTRPTIFYRLGNNKQLLFRTTLKRFGIYSAGVGTQNEFQITYLTAN